MSQSSVIGAATIVRGNVEGQGSLEIHGRVEGDVTMSGEVLVGENGAVLGQISASRISVSGAVQGDLRGSESVSLERGAKVVGDLDAPRVGIANGALVRGNVRTEGEPPAAQNRRLAAPTAAAKPAPYASKSAAFVAKPVAKVEAKPPAPAPREATIAISAPTRPQEPERRPPPPVVPSLGKGAKGKRKGREE